MENARLLRLLELTPSQARPPGPAQAGIFDTAPGSVDGASSPRAKVAFYGALFSARRDTYALRWENTRTGRSGWVPAVRGGWRKDRPPALREYLPLTEEVITVHLSGDIELGLYPMLDGDRCGWLAADFDGQTAMLDALAYLKAARAVGVPAALEVSHSGLGAHSWIFFTAPVPAALARQVGTGLLREAIALRGRMSLSSYDRLFPSQDVLETGGPGNLIAAPLQGRARRRGTTVLLDLATLEPHPDQGVYLSTVARLTPKEVARIAQRLGGTETVSVGPRVSRLRAATSTRITVPLPPIVRGGLAAVQRPPHRGSGITPTGVGRTTRTSTVARRAPDHPHGRGEDRVPRRLARIGDGSPPRAWGGRLRPPDDQGNLRITPTGVGRTDQAVSAAAMPADHPHGRGEDPCASPRTWLRRGSPPRAWGGRAPEVLSGGEGRITPTGVGRTVAGHRTVAPGADHPHGRGEDS